MLPWAAFPMNPIKNPCFRDWQRTQKERPPRTMSDHLCYNYHLNVKYNHYHIYAHLITGLCNLSFLHPGLGSSLLRLALCHTHFLFISCFFKLRMHGTSRMAVTYISIKSCIDIFGLEFVISTSMVTILPFSKCVCAEYTLAKLIWIS